MKKILSLLAAALMLFAAGCEKPQDNSKNTVIPKNFSSDAEITFRDIYMTANLTVTDENGFVVRMITPEVLSPLEIVCKNGICTASYDGIGFSVETNRFPQSDFARIAAQAFAYALADVELKKSVSDGIISYQGNTDSGVFQLTQDVGSGALRELSVEGAQLHIVFKDFKII